jgi:hypothetical protein
MTNYSERHSAGKSAENDSPVTTSRRPQSYRLQYRDTITTLIGPNFMAFSYWSDITFQNRFGRAVQNISQFNVNIILFIFPI